MTEGMRLIAITGGIGSGKSVVSRMLRAMGYPVYDCDSEAKRLMDGSAEIKACIAARISAEAICSDGSINRPALAAIVFSDPRKLNILNSIVHTAVRDDIASFAAAQGGGTVFVETAILYQSGLDRMADEVWDVTAPESVRIARVMTRNGFTAAQVTERIRSQEFTPERLHPAIHEIVNDGATAVLPQVEKLLH